MKKFFLIAIIMMLVNGIMAQNSTEETTITDSIDNIKFEVKELQSLIENLENKWIVQAHQLDYLGYQIDSLREKQDNLLYEGWHLEIKRRIKEIKPDEAIITFKAITENDSLIAIKENASLKAIIDSLIAIEEMYFGTTKAIQEIHFHKSLAYITIIILDFVWNGWKFEEIEIERIKYEGGPFRYCSINNLGCYKLLSPDGKEIKWIGEYSL